MAQISRVLDKHTDPNMAGPPGQFTQVENLDGTTSNVYIGGGRYFR